MGYGGVGTKLPNVVEQDMVGAIYHTALYKDNSAPPRNMVLMMQTSQNPAVCSKAVRIAIIDILGCRVLLRQVWRHTILSQSAASPSLATHNSLTMARSILIALQVECQIINQVLDFSTTSNINQQNYAKQWHRTVMAYGNGLWWGGDKATQCG